MSRLSSCLTRGPRLKNLEDKPQNSFLVLVLVSRAPTIVDAGRRRRPKNFPIGLPAKRVGGDSSEAETLREGRSPMDPFWSRKWRYSEIDGTIAMGALGSQPWSVHMRNASSPKLLVRPLVSPFSPRLSKCLKESMASYQDYHPSFAALRGSTAGDER
jgi:hypothetical protein